jgi:acyl carrier protein
MGLDVVELVMSIEESFGVRIPDAAAERMKTGRHIVRWLERVVPMGECPCLTQRAFYRLRRAIQTRAPASSAPIRPNTGVAELFEGDDGNRDWKSIGEEFGMRGRWSAVTGRNWHGFGQWTNPVTLRDIVDDLVRYSACRFMGPGEGWSTAKIGAVLASIVTKELGVDPDGYTLDLRFQEDIGAD